MQTLTQKPTEEHRWQSRANCAIGTQVEVRYEFRNGEPVMASVADLHKNGCGLGLPTPLETGASIVITGLQASGPARKVSGRVVWCRVTSARAYRAGIAFFQPLTVDEPLIRTPEELPEDYYEDLEISPRATAETVQYMFRLLEHRYHPDNPRTADAERLRRVQRAFDVLSTPSTRAMFDQQREAALARRDAALSARQHSFGPDTAAQSANEKSKRWDLLGLLYAKRMNTPAKPGLTLSEVEAVMGLMKDDVEFAFWYLQEAGLAVPDHGHNRYSISVKGVDIFESRLEAIAEAER